MIGAEIDDLEARRQAVGGHLLGGAMRHTQEDDVDDLAELGRVEGGHVGQIDPREGRQHRAERLPGRAVAADADDVNMGVLMQEAQQLGAGVSGGTDDGDAGRRSVCRERGR